MFFIIELMTWNGHEKVANLGIAQGRTALEVAKSLGCTFDFDYSPYPEERSVRCFLTEKGPDGEEERVRLRIEQVEEITTPDSLPSAGGLAEQVKDWLYHNH